jgi:hypothetical protein
MKKLINPFIEKTVDVLKYTRSAITPFSEKPASEEMFPGSDDDERNMNATELFSFFTADIIKQKVLFTR